jgi:mutator protein MutT
MQIVPVQRLTIAVRQTDVGRSNGKHSPERQAFSRTAMIQPNGMLSICVAAAVVEREGRFFVARRHDGTHLEGYWEFPGGKREPGETDEACLAREMREELGVDVQVGRLLLSVSHAYPDRTVELHFYACEMAGVPRPLLDQELRWVAREELRALQFPPADAELIAMLTTA